MNDDKPDRGAPGLVAPDQCDQRGQDVDSHDARELRTPGQASTRHAELDLEHFLPYRLSVLSNRVSSAIARVYVERFALGVTEWRVMAVLGRYPDLSANQVAQRTAMDKVAVSRAVARLVESGRLQRELHDDDRRRSVLRLSDAGQQIYDEVAPLALVFERRLLDGMDADERALLFRLLDRLDDLEIRAEAEPPP